MSMDKTILDSLATKAADDWNQKHVLGRAPRYGETVKATGNATVNDLTIGALGEAVAAIQRLKARIEALEKRTIPKYLGVHKPGATYSEGSMVTRDGSIFYCNKTTTANPGDGSQDWTLAVKRGRDGKDGVAQ